jgi:hypothetical protein
MDLPEIELVVPGLWFWQSWVAAVKCDCSSCAFLTPAGLVLVDPIPFSGELPAPAAAIALTSGNHLRAAVALREKLRVPILAPAAAEAELGIAADRVLDDDALPGVRVLPLAGAGPGEVALLSPFALHFGDALIHVESHGFSLLPEKYCADAAQMRRSLHTLLDHDFTAMTFAHGSPILRDAKPRLAALCSLGQ